MAFVAIGRHRAYKARRSAERRRVFEVFCRAHSLAEGEAERGALNLSCARGECDVGIWCTAPEIRALSADTLAQTPWLLEAAAALDEAHALWRGIQ